MLERVVHFKPGFDKRNPSDPSKNYGISGGSLLFVVKGPLGAVHFSFGTNFYPRSAEQHLVNCYTDGRMARFGEDGVAGIAKSFRPMGFDVGYHAHSPSYEGQGISQEACEWLDGKPCYSDGSALRATDWMQQFLENGTEWLWPALEAEYSARFLSTPEVAPQKPSTGGNNA